MDGLIRWMVYWTDGWMVCWMKGLFEWMDGLMAGWTDGWFVVRMNEMDFFFFLIISKWII